MLTPAFLLRVWNFSSGRVPVWLVPNKNLGLWVSVSVRHWSMSYMTVWREDSRKLTPGFLRTLPPCADFSLSDFTLHAFIVINHSLKYEYMLSLVSPSSKLLNMGVVVLGPSTHWLSQITWVIFSAALFLIQMFLPYLLNTSQMILLQYFCSFFDHNAIYLSVLAFSLPTWCPLFIRCVFLCVCECKYVCTDRFIFMLLVWPYHPPNLKSFQALS